VAEVQNDKAILKKLIPQNFDSNNKKSEAGTDLFPSQKKAFENLSNKIKTRWLELSQKEILLTSGEENLND
jgi:hypothetical protein